MIYRLHEPRTDKRGRSYVTVNLLACKWHEGRTRITKSEIQNRDRRAMTYGHVSSTAKHRNQVNKRHGDQGETVESIMAMGFICVMFDCVEEAHAYCMKQHQPDKQAKYTDGVGAERYSHQEAKTDQGAHSSGRTDCLPVSKTMIRIIAG
eukprot:6091544-Heterocapsa_arctica.AAC.1